MYLIFDTETSGLPRYWNAPVSDTDNWPRLVQIAWLLYNADAQLIDNQSFIIRPEGFVIPQSASRIHGISHEQALKEGIALEEVLALFDKRIEEARYLIGHNIAFDEKIVGTEFFRKRIESKLFERPHVCTMRVSTALCAIPGKHGYKWPSLGELYENLFNETFQDAHNAQNDVQATARCFWELKHRRILKI